MGTILVIPDTHAPAMHRDAVDFLRECKKKYRPTRVVHLGDELDLCALSFYDHDPDGLSAGPELEAGIAQLRGLYETFPEVSVCVSNHGARPFRRAAKFGIPMAFMREYRDYMRAPDGWWWKPHWDIDGIRFFHGEGTSGALSHLKAAIALARPVVQGHLHTGAGIAWAANPERLLWGMNAGCLIDREKYNFAYGRHNLTKPILGCGVIENGRPRFVTMDLDGHGRWKGTL
jgi:hypothetical protein